MPGPDRYEVNALLKPALFCLLPVLAPQTAWLREVWTAPGGLLTLPITCGDTVLVKQIARQRGHKLEAGRLTLNSERSVTLFSHADVVIR